MTEDTDAAPNVPDWLRAMFADVDRMDSAGFASHFADGACWNFGNLPVLEGKPAIAGAANYVFAMLNGIEHQWLNVWSPAHDVTFAEGRVLYTRKDGHIVTVPFAGVYELNSDGKVAVYRTYIDSAPLYADL